MLKIIIPNNNIAEREYAIDILFHQFLDLSYELSISKNAIDYKIILPNQKSIIINDNFFSQYPQDLSYLKASSIPLEVHYQNSPFFSEKNLPILFGTNKIEHHTDYIRTDIDVFATLFFMLTRWEEYVIKDRDEHNRFPHQSSLAYKNNFLNRAIVNEYVEFFWNMLNSLDNSIVRKQQNFSLLLTHDVDEIERYLTPKNLLKALAGDIIYRKSLIKLFQTLTEYIQIKRSNKKDPYDTFEMIMNMSEEFGLKSHFFFMAGGTSKKYDNRYKIESDKSHKIINNIQDRGHFIGIHPSYNAYNNALQFKKEKDALEKVSLSKITSGREHYLRFEVPITWQLWEENEYKWCSNLAYAQQSGFRTGCCIPYTPFNILSRKQLTIVERPLILMEATFAQEVQSVEAFNKLADYYFDIVKKYQGEFVLLWHNASFNEPTIKKYNESYLHILNRYKEISI